METSRPRFRNIDVDRVARQLQGIAVLGKVIAPKSARMCKICRRKIGPLGRLPALGFPCCNSSTCQLTRSSEITEPFETPYGRAIDRATIGMIAQIVDLPDGRIVIQRQPIVERATALADALHRLIQWQSAYDHYEWFTNPDMYQRGALELIPPRRIEDVLVLRASEQPTPTDPTGGLPPDTARLLKRIYKRGPEALQPAF